MVGTEIKIYIFRTVLVLFCLYLRAISKYKVPGTYLRSGDLTEGSCITSWGAYFGNFTIAKLRPERDKENERVESCSHVTGNRQNIFHSRIKHRDIDELG